MTSSKRHSARRPPASARSARLAAVPTQLDLLDDARLRQIWRRVNEEAARNDQRAAEDAFDQGTLLNEIASLSVNISFDTLIAEYVDGPAMARERMAIAKCTTRLMAGYYGLDRLRLGLRLLPHFKLNQLDELEAVDLPIPSADGKPLRFPATREHLDRALALLETTSR